MIVFSAWPVIAFAAVLRFQDAGPANDNFSVTASALSQQADKLYNEGKLVQALPLYTSLEKREPNNSLYAERRAAGLIAKSATRGKVSQQLALQREAYTELLRARGLGDNSPYVLSLLDKLNQLFAGPTSATIPADANPAQSLKQGQAAFSGGNYKVALSNYAAAALADPHSYDAALSAGLAEVRLHDLEAAGSWFSKAITIKPNRDTAYREWGNALLDAKQPLPARDHFVDGVIAWPYEKTAWDGLQHWAEVSHAKVSSPHLDRPQATEDFDMKMFSEDGSGRSAWLQYLVGRTTYRKTLFKQKFPHEAVYRHTLEEEVTCLRRTAESARMMNISSGKIDPSINTLLELVSNHMLEQWILLHGADSGIVQDYAAYRDAHRGLLRAYIIQYDIQIQHDVRPVH